MAYCTPCQAFMTPNLFLISPLLHIYFLHFRFQCIFPKPSFFHLFISLHVVIFHFTITPTCLSASCFYSVLHNWNLFVFFLRKDVGNRRDIVWAEWEWDEWARHASRVQVSPNWWRAHHILPCFQGLQWLFLWCGHCWGWSQQMRALGTPWYVSDSMHLSIYSVLVYCLVLYYLCFIELCEEHFRNLMHGIR